MISFNILIIIVTFVLFMLIFSLFKILATDKKVQILYEKLLGSQTKGTIGENILRNIILPYINTGIIVEKLQIEGTKEVDFAIELEEGIYCAIDQKTGSNKVKKDIEEIANKYIGKSNTTFFGILTTPDNIYDKFIKEKDYALEKGIFIIKNSDIPYIIPIIKRLYNKFKMSEDVKKLNKEIALFNSFYAEAKKLFDPVEKNFEKFKNYFLSLR